MTPQEFKAKWSTPSGNERQTYTEHFRDLCALLNQPTPSAADRADLDYTFERAVTTATGAQGFADVWKRGFFGWEYKGDKKNLDAAYTQLLAYKDALENPPLLVVSDTKLIRIHTNFTNRAKVVRSRSRSARIDDQQNLAILRFLFTQPEIAGAGAHDRRRHRGGRRPLRPDRDRAPGPRRGAAPDRPLPGPAPLLPLRRGRQHPAPRPGQRHARLHRQTPGAVLPAITELLSAMDTGGYVNYQEIPRVNGGLFRTIQPLELATGRAGHPRRGRPARLVLGRAGHLRHPLRALARSRQPGQARRPLHRQARHPARRRAGRDGPAPPAMGRGPGRGRHAESRLGCRPARPKQDNARAAFARQLFEFPGGAGGGPHPRPRLRLRQLPLRRPRTLLELEKEVIAYGVASGLSGMLPVITTDQLLGLEINEYARELAQVVIWIGYLQWMIRNGFGFTRSRPRPARDDPLQDALLDRTDPDHPKEAEWPEADYIIGNPPFLGGKRDAQELGDEYVDDLFRVYGDRVDPRVLTSSATSSRRRVRRSRRTKQTALAYWRRTPFVAVPTESHCDRIKETGDIFLGLVGRAVDPRRRGRAHFNRWLRQRR